MGIECKLAIRCVSRFHTTLRYKNTQKVRKVIVLHIIILYIGLLRTNLRIHLAPVADCPVEVVDRVINKGETVYYLQAFSLTEMPNVILRITKWFKLHY